MKRISTATRVLNKFGAGKDGFTDGDVVGGVPSTDLEAALFDNIQEEIANVVEAAGITLNGAVRTQLLSAVRVVTPGRLIGVRIIATTQVYTPTVGTTAVRVLLVGGGGGGGGSVAPPAGSAGSGAGGGGAGWSQKWITSGFSGVTVTVGAGGGGGVGAANGVNGGTTSFGALFSAGGGAGGLFGPVNSVSGSPFTLGFGTAGAGSGGDVNGTGETGKWAYYASNPQSGEGGSSYFGGGGSWRTGYATGGNGVGFGAGGGGGNSPPSNGNATGGTGAVGICIIEEYS